MKNFIKLFLLNQETTMATSIPATYENSIIEQLLKKAQDAQLDTQSKKQSSRNVVELLDPNKTDDERLEEMSQ